MSWSFAVVNHRLAEIFFERRKGVFVPRGHCYVDKKDYTTQKEIRWIREDTARLQFSYRFGRYRRINTFPAS